MSNATPASRDTRATAALPAAHPVRRLQRNALMAGVVGTVLCGIGALINPTQFLRSYLVAFLFWTALPLGALAILMIQHITGGAWGAVIRRVLEAATHTVPLMAVLFVVLIPGLHTLYEWADPAHVAMDPSLQHKSAYLNVRFFLIRALIYFGSWTVIIAFLTRWSDLQDGTGDERYAARMELLSRGGLLWIGLTVTFASIDWVMSLEPHWYSTIYGILFAGGAVLAAMAFVIPVLLMLSESPPVAEVVEREQFHDLGKLLLAFVMLWAYFAFSQFLLIWSGNLPEETAWYMSRLRGGWEWFGVALIVLHFALPFAILLSRDVTRRPRRLAIVASGILVLRYVDVYWLVTPAFSPAAFTWHWLDAAAFIAVGGWWLLLFASRLAQRPLLPVHDPSLVALHHHRHAAPAHAGAVATAALGAGAEAGRT